MAPRPRARPRRSRCGCSSVRPPGSTSSPTSARWSGCPPTCRVAMLTGWQSGIGCGSASPRRSSRCSRSSRRPIPAAARGRRDDPRSHAKRWQLLHHGDASIAITTGDGGDDRSEGVSRRLPLRSRVALAASRAASELSARLGRGHGTVIGGAIATRIDPSVLRRLGAGRTTVFISATNGKSTTAALLAAAVRATLGPTVHNDGGSNMESGLIVALDGDHDAPFAILEVDELYLGPLSRALRPQVMTLMNIARDYLERGVRYKRLLRHWRDTIGRMDWPCTIIANADDPFVVWALRGPRGPKPPEIVWVAGGHRWAGDGMVCRDDLVALRTDPTSNPPGDWW